MLFQKKIGRIYAKTLDTLRSLASLSTSDPANQEIRFRVYCQIWQAKHKYVTERTSHYVSKRHYNDDLDKITSLEKQIHTDEAYEKEAREAVAEAREFLDLVAGYRVRNYKKPRVY